VATGRNSQLQPVNNDESVVTKNECVFFLCCPCLQLCQKAKPEELAGVAQDMFAGLVQLLRCSAGACRRGCAHTDTQDTRCWLLAWSCRWAAPQPTLAMPKPCGWLSITLYHIISPNVRCCVIAVHVLCR
jgi:hypothetical protein